jgi:hypothetical protein
MTARPRPRLRTILLAGAAALAGLAACLLLVPAPRAALPWVAERSSGWLLSEYEGSGALPGRVARKVVGLWLQQGLAAQIAEADTTTDSADDADRIVRRLTYLKTRFISQTELLHGPPNSPAALAGLGWCDGINGFAATVLSNDFPRAEIVGVVDRQARAGHSFGRAWSDQYSDWLYFDLWTDEIVVFRSGPGRGAEMLRRARPLGARRLPLEAPELFRRIYDRAHSGFVQYRLQPTLGGYLFSRLANLVSTGSTSPEGTAEAIAAASAITFPNDPNLLPPTPPVAAGDYVRARIHHLLGDEAKARESYRRVVEAEERRSSGYSQAARLFLNRLAR